MTNPRKYRDKIKIQEEKMKLQQQEFERTMLEVSPIFDRRHEKILNYVIELDLQSCTGWLGAIEIHRTGFVPPPEAHQPFLSDQEEESSSLLPSSLSVSLKVLG
uniref:Uncharacterized protein n=1 Tax=Anopheles culicifacies TaxID=139723 RepID=A0A182MS40_9DIPT